MPTALRIAGIALATTVLLWAHSAGNLSGMPSLGARSMGPLEAMAQTVAAKLKRDPAAYARSLVALERHRVFLPPEQVPTVATTAALARYFLPRAETVKGWQSVAKELTGKERNRALSDIGAVARKIEGALAGVTAKSTTAQLKAAERSRLNPALLWNREHREPAIRDRQIRALAEALRSVRDSVPLVEPQDRTLRNLFLARATWAFSQLLWFADPKTSGTVLSELKDHTSAFIELMTPPDSDIIRIALNEVQLSLLPKAPPAKAQLAARLATLKRLDQETGFLCEPRATGTAGDFLLQTAWLARQLGMELPPVAPIAERCLVGIGGRGFPSPWREDGGLLGFLPPLTPSSSARMAFAELGHADFDLELRLAREAEWSLYFGFAGLLDAPPISGKAYSGSCGKDGNAPKALCDQIAWHYHFEEPIAALGALSDGVGMPHARSAALVLLADLATRQTTVPGVPHPGQNSRWNKHSFYKSLERYLDRSDPDFATLEWHIINLESSSHR